MKRSQRQNARERRMARRAVEHCDGRVRVVERRASYRVARYLTKECRRDDPAGRYVYIASGSGHGFNVLELLQRRPQ